LHRHDGSNNRRESFPPPSTPGDPMKIKTNVKAGTEGKKVQQ